MLVRGGGKNLKFRSYDEERLHWESILSEDIKWGDESGFLCGKSTHSGDSNYKVSEAEFDLIKKKNSQVASAATEEWRSTKSQRWVLKSDVMYTWGSQGGFWLYPEGQVKSLERVLNTGNIAGSHWGFKRIIPVLISTKVRQN